MPLTLRFSILLTGFLLALQTSRAAEPIAVVETTLTTAGQNIRQFALDGDLATAFTSFQAPTEADHFTLLLDQPVTMKSVTVITGTAEKNDLLQAGVLEVSADGLTFTETALFKDGQAMASPGDKPVKAVRIRPLKGQKHPLVVREITLDAQPAVGVFRYPVEFVINVDDAPR